VYPCKLELHIGTHLLSAGEAGGFGKVRTVVQPVLILHDFNRAEQVERCRREVAASRRAVQNASLTRAERFGAMQGEVDWPVAFQMAEEEEPPLRATL
jgi:hypothetical protein